MKDLKLFYWKEALVEYTSGCAFALAQNAEEARDLIIDKYKKDMMKNSGDSWFDKERLGSIYLEKFLKELEPEPEVFNTSTGFYCEGGS